MNRRQSTDTTAPRVSRRRNAEVSEAKIARLQVNPLICTRR